MYKTKIKISPEEAKIKNNEDTLWRLDMRGTVCRSTYYCITCGQQYSSSCLCLGAYAICPDCNLPLGLVSIPRLTNNYFSMPQQILSTGIQLSPDIKINEWLG